MEVLLDTSFIISCIRKRIDFLLQLKERGFKIIVPREVIEELKDLKTREGESHEDRIAVNVALEMLDSRDIKKISLGGMKVDSALIRKGKEGAYIATLDGEIKRKVPNKVIISSARNEVEVIRGK